LTRIRIGWVVSKDEKNDVEENPDAQEISPRRKQGNCEDVLRRRKKGGVKKKKGGKTTGGETTQKKNMVWFGVELTNPPVKTLTEGILNQG